MMVPTEEQRAELGAEDVLWCGKSRPTPFLRGCWPRMIAAILGGIFLGFAFTMRIGPAVRDLYRGTSAYPIVDWVHVVMYSGMALLMIWYLLTPLYNWIKSRGTTWIVTNRRVVSFFGSRVESWDRTEWLDPVRIEERSNGCRDILFTRRQVLKQQRSNRGWIKYGIENVPGEDADILYEVFSRLQKKDEKPKSAVRNDRLKKMIDDFYRPDSSLDREAGEYC